MACTLVLENGFEITGTYCIDMTDLINEETRKQKASQLAYVQYGEIKNAIDREYLYHKYFAPERSELLVK